MSKFAWFATEKGKAFSGTLTFVAITTGALYKWLPNTYLMEQVKEVVQLYK